MAEYGRKKIARRSGSLAPFAKWHNITLTLLDTLRLNDKHSIRLFRTLVALSCFALIIVLYIATRLWRLTTYGLWADEITSFQAAQENWSSLLTFAVQDIVHPPLFYALLKMWISVGGESLLWIRLFPVLTAVAAIIPFVLLCREMRVGTVATSLAMFLSAVNGYLVYYAQELRMYSLLLFFSLCSLWLFARYVNMEEHHRPDLVGLFTVNLLLVYTQYYGWLLIATEWIFLSLWYHAKLRRFSFYTALVVLCFTPWCLLVAQALLDKHGLSSNLSWIRVPTVQDGVWFYTILNGPLRFNWSRATTVFGLVTFGTPVLAGLWRRGVRSSKDAGESALRSDAVLWFLALVAGVPTLIAFATSYVLPQSVWHPRYLIAVAMPYLLLVAVAVGDLRRQWLRITAMLIIAAWATLSGVAEIRTADRVSWAPVIQRMVDAAPSEGQINIYTYGSHDIQFYLDALGEERFNVVRMFDRTALPNTDYGWVSFRVHGDRYRMSIQDTTQSEVQALDRLIHDLTAKGYQTGNILEAGTPGYRIFLFAISR